MPEAITPVEIIEISPELIRQSQDVAQAYLSQASGLISVTPILTYEGSWRERRLIKKSVRIEFDLAL